jgi:hypothetical protein
MIFSISKISIVLRINSFKADILPSSETSVMNCGSLKVSQPAFKIASRLPASSAGTPSWNLSATACTFSLGAKDIVFSQREITMSEIVGTISFVTASARSKAKRSALVPDRIFLFGEFLREVGFDYPVSGAMLLKILSALPNRRILGVALLHGRRLEHVFEAVEI